MKKKVYNKEQLTLALCANLFVAVLVAGLFGSYMFEGFDLSLSRGEAKRTSALLGLIISCILFFTFGVLTFWLASLASKQRDFIFYIGLLLASFLTVRYLWLIGKSWKKLS